MTTKIYVADYNTIIQLCINSSLPVCQNLIEHGITSAPTHYSLYGQRFLQVCYNNTTEKVWQYSLLLLTKP